MHIGNKTDIEELENQFVSGTWAPPFLDTSPAEPPKKKKKKTKSIENKQEKNTNLKSNKKKSKGTELFIIFNAAYIC